MKKLLSIILFSSFVINSISAEKVIIPVTPLIHVAPRTKSKLTQRLEKIAPLVFAIAGGIATNWSYSKYRTEHDAFVEEMRAHENPAIRDCFQEDKELARQALIALNNPGNEENRKELGAAYLESPHRGPILKYGVATAVAAVITIVSTYKTIKKIFMSQSSS